MSEPKTAPGLTRGTQPFHYDHDRQAISTGSAHNQPKTVKVKRPRKEE